MAEDQGKEEEKFDFTGEGEAVSYISLEQARLLAMQTARESPGDYGNQYRNVPMAFAVVQSDEGEDYYEVTLSLRPQGDFSGRPGQEQFFIEKEGTVAHRQVLSLPAGGGRRFPVLLVAIGVVIVGVIAAVAVIFAVGGFGDGGELISEVAPAEINAPTEKLTPTAVPPTPTPTAVPPTLTPTPAPIPQIIKSKTTAVGYNKGVGFLTWDYTVEVRISVVNAGAPGFVEAKATVRWDGNSKTRRERFYMTAAEEKNFVLEFIEVGSADKWTWSADARAVR